MLSYSKYSKIFTQEIKKKSNNVTYFSHINGTLLTAKVSTNAIANDLYHIYHINN